MPGCIGWAGRDNCPTSLEQVIKGFSSRIGWELCTAVSVSPETEKSCYGLNFQGKWPKFYMHIRNEKL